MKIKIIFIFLLFFFQCASEKGYHHTFEKEIESKTTVDATEIHNGLKGEFLFYVSKQNSLGDIWLYNLSKNNKWQITSVNNKNLQILSLSPSYQYLIYNIEEDKNVIYDLKKNDEMDFYSSFNETYSFSLFKDITWKGTGKFFFIGSTNNKSTNIFQSTLNDENKWVVEKLDISSAMTFLNEDRIYSLSLSYNQQLLAFIARNPINQLFIYVYDLSNKKIKKMIPVKQISQLIWSENNKNIFFHDEDYFIYSINFRGAKELVVSGGKLMEHLFYHPDQRFKFFYVTQLNEFYFVSLKNIDYVGQGDFLFNTKNLKDLNLFKKSDLMFYDNTSNEIYYYNLKTSEIRKILDNASLLKLSP